MPNTLQFTFQAFQFILAKGTGTLALVIETGDIPASIFYLSPWES